MVRPERRTRGDIAAVVVIVAAALLGAGVLWLGSDARATISETAAEPLPEQPVPTSVPDALHEAWRAPSAATPVPVIAGPAVVTGNGNEVLGHDPVTGQVAWRYARDIPLCTIGTEWDRAVAVFRKSHNCSEVTSLRGPTGERGPQRNSDAEFGTRLLGDGTYLTATGTRSFESWRSDLVRTQQFGIPPQLKNPKNNIERPDCTYSSIAVGHGRAGVVENCPGETGRITAVKLHPEDDEKPEEDFSVSLGSRDAAVVAVSEHRVAVVMRDSSQLLVFDDQGGVVESHPVRVGPLASDDNVRVEATAIGRRVYWHTGVDTIALDPKTLTPLWTSPDTLGAGTSLANRLVVPVRDAMAVLDPMTGAVERVVPVDRSGYTGPVRLNSLGPVVLEQRGDTLVALR
ncbi:hypothetical protein EIL87_16365 [Saccharopolyspora rhizosphaerae]|uniref:PQQ-binding-like beta-propeller repeat protein n=1 Tax=Saccharopolyspora rhizosphaerae TaxID=2492662 RepID=A0A426JR19_9PSEU|nr:hypothetical protein [Saccharopolyspora rhizosphaerae]RRO15594.1 hypothetical protein EIL87_16365 [Saccharopolyspora rhizosphaerae]